MARIMRPPHLILLDSMIHGQGHALFVEEYRRLPGPHAPIYLFTAAMEAEEAARQLQLSGVLAKPFDIEALIALAERHAGQKGR
jgi:CheY-like chemotaxis protein